MSRIKFMIAVCILAQLTTYSEQSEYTGLNLTQLFPGYVKEFVFFTADNGTTFCVNLTGNATTKEDYNLFLEKETELDNEIDLLDSGNLTVTRQCNVTNVTETFDFNNTAVTFTFYNRKYINGIRMENFTFSEYNTSKLTKFVTHGFISSGTSEMCMSITYNYLNISDMNVIVMDWSAIADDLIYPIPVAATGLIADYCAEFFINLFNSIGVKKQDTHLIGHSMGAHIVGFMGKRLKLQGFEVGRITGLDPAGPLYEIVHINYKCGNFVDIIHTDAGVLGLNQRVGHVDFYPNGGSAPQPGCENVVLLMADSCSHGRSYQYFGISIMNKSLYMSNCSSNSTYHMGSTTPPFARGQCYLRTRTIISETSTSILSTIESFLTEIGDTVISAPTTLINLLKAVL